MDGMIRIGDMACFCDGMRLRTVRSGDKCHAVMAADEPRILLAVVC
jgi:hypothetical protein